MPERPNADATSVLEPGVESALRAAIVALSIHGDTCGHRAIQLQCPYCDDRLTAGRARKALVALLVPRTEATAHPVLDAQGPDDDMGRHVFVRPSSWGPDGFDVGVGTDQNVSSVRLTSPQMNDLRLLLGSARIKADRA